LFNELTADTSRYLLERVPARVNEIPLIAYFADFGNWLILTTERLVWSNKNNVTSPESSDIVDASVDAAALMSARAKDKLEDLAIRVRSDASYRIKVEPGPPFLGLWNVLKAVAAGNTRKQSGSKVSCAALAGFEQGPGASFEVPQSGQAPPAEQ
jgi:hypothetical protein